MKQKTFAAAFLQSIDTTHLTYLWYEEVYLYLFYIV